MDAIKRAYSTLLPVVLFCIFGVPLATFAADTVEAVDEGSTGLDVYVNFNRLGLKQHNQTVVGTTTLGYGFVQGTSAYLGTAVQLGQGGSEENGQLGGGFISTLLETDHCDIDLIFEVRFLGPKWTDFQVEPSFEFNADMDPKMRTLGFYLRSGFSVQMQDLLMLEQHAAGHEDTGSGLVATAGIYYFIGKMHQLFLEHDLDFTSSQFVEKPVLNESGIALGCNVAVTRFLELISQVYIELPLDQQQVPCLSVSLGLVINSSQHAELPRSLGP